MRNTAAIVILAAILTLTSCVNRQEAKSARVQVSVTVPAGFDTDMIRMFLFDAETGESSGEVFLSKRNGDTFAKTVSLRCNDYEILCYNFDIPDTFLKGESEAGTLEYYTKPVGQEVRKRFLLDENAQVVYSPDCVVAGSTAAKVTGTTEYLSADAVEATSTWHIEIKAEGAQYAVASGCIISGEIISLKPFSDGNDSTGSIYFDLSKGADCLYADFNTFGHSRTEEIGITVFVNNGSDVYNYTKSITQLVGEAAKDGSHRLSVSAAVKIPAPKSSQEGGSGFNPRVGEWDQENSEILI